MDKPGPPYYGRDAWDDANGNEHHPRSQEILRNAHAEIERWLDERASVEILSLSRVLAFHRHMFGGLFPDFAGRLRGNGTGEIPVNVTFARFAGTDYRQVAQEIAMLFQQVERWSLQLDVIPSSSPSFTDQLLTVAAFTHCEIVRIHPFLNGNGRIARLCINYFAWRYGFLPLPLGRPQPSERYTAANHSWIDYRHRGMQDALAPMVNVLRPYLKRRP